MKKELLLVLASLFFSLTSSQGVANTTILVTKGATDNGSVLVGHSDDDELGDQRIIYVPPADHPSGAKRAVYPNFPYYPRYVGKDKGPGYDTLGLPSTKAIGYIDEVPHTYGYFDGNYGIINEHQLAIGECSNLSNFQSDSDPKKRILPITELSRIALERCTKAREAILLMGSLIEKYGYYGSGETLLLGDTEEGWVFEICPSPEGEGALWVAERVPDGEVFVAANQFRIRNVDPNDPNMLFSKSVFKIAQDNNLWSPDSKEPLDWLKMASPGEFDHPYYSLRRVWRILSRVAPSLNLSPWVKDAFTRDYPFSIKPDKKLSVRDIFALYRDHYEGTEFDLTKGLAAGPFGCPQRYLGPYDRVWETPDQRKSPLPGAWERPISIFYCGFSYVNQLREFLPDPIGGICWFGLDAPKTTCYVPFYVGINNLPYSFQVGNPMEFTRVGAWWAFNFVNNLAALKYSYITQDVLAKQTELEDREWVQQEALEQQALELIKKDPTQAQRFLTQYCLDNAAQVVTSWWELAKFVIEKYADGYINKPTYGQAVGYPESWRKAVGYDKGPTTYGKPSSENQGKTKE